MYAQFLNISTNFSFALRWFEIFRTRCSLSLSLAHKSHIRCNKIPLIVHHLSRILYRSSTKYLSIFASYIATSELCVLYLPNTFSYVRAHLFAHSLSSFPVRVNVSMVKAEPKPKCSVRRHTYFDVNSMSISYIFTVVVCATCNICAKT